ncbi:MAG: SoxR reducing system RseC family protein [Candidatus Omnitrophica bacterium]|nr:SoxR reducing system RseC family protein [Candidatus Omnitrophota bacterium]
MSTSSEIQHDGTIVELKRDSIMVKIERSSACASCHSQKSCSLSEMEEKIIEISQNPKPFNKGEKVLVILPQKTGFLAVFIAYIVPLIIFIASLAIISLFTKIEIIVGLSAISAIIIYYFALSCFKHKFGNKFRIDIRKL